MRSNDNAIGSPQTAGRILPFMGNLFSSMWTRVRTDAWPLTGVALQLLAVAIVFLQLDMLTSAFRRVYCLAAAGFVLNHLLPKQYRLQFFGVLCVLAILLVLGGAPDTMWDADLAFTRTLPLLIAGGVLVGICLLPIAFWWRVGLLLLVSSGIALMRAGVIEVKPLLIVWPLLASLFMFRLIIFLYDVHANRMRPKPGEIVAYFLMFPNIASTLFPLVDFKTMTRSWYDSPDFDIYRRGAQWIIRGVLQLLLYRLIQQLAAIDPQQVANGTDLIQFVLASTFAYVQVSGYFHLVIGMLLLFGFNLPETNRRYFLATSFTEYWRRVNIYWKDFIVKVIYYPAYFRLKSRGPMVALVLATMWSFFITWALHLYQTWWVKGSAEITWPDGLFWSILALLVLVNSVWEMKRGRQRKLASSSYDFRTAAGVLLRTAGTFSCVALLWSLWSSPTLGTWLAMWKHADWNTLLWAAVALAGIMAAAYFYEIRPRAAAKPDAKAAARPSEPTLRNLVVRVAPLVLVLLIAHPGVQARFDRVALQPWYDAIGTGDSMMDQLVTRNRGYYERLTSVDDANRQLWETLRRQKLIEAYTGEDPIRPVNDLRFREPIPSVHVQAYETDYQTNSIGLRDREYPLVADASTLRVVVLGSSHVMGWGVPLEKTFAKRVEEQLEATPIPGAEGARFEVINFAFNGLGPLGQIDLLRKRVGQYQPDIVLMVMHGFDYDQVNRDLPRSLRAGVPLNSEYLEQVLRDARITARTHEVIAQNRLKPYEKDATSWAYSRIADEIRKMHAVPMAIMMALPEQLPLKSDAFTNQLDRIRSAGFETFDLSKAFGDNEAADLMLHDRHTNAAGHQLMAEALYQALTHDRTFIALAQQKAAAGKVRSAAAQ